MKHGGRFGGPLFLLAAVFGAVSWPFGCSVAPADIPTEIIGIRTPDGVELTATLTYEGGRPFRSLVVTVHEAGGGSGGWAPPEALLRAEGHAVVRWDLRGHAAGPSGPQGKTYREFDAADWARCADDLVQVAHAAREAAGADTPLILLGEGFGALLALDYARRHGGAAGVAMISPPRAAHGLDGPGLARGFDGCPLLIMAAENDQTRHTAALAIKDAAPGFSEIRVYSGTARGADLLADKPDALQQLAGWIDLVLLPETPVPAAP